MVGSAWSWVCAHVLEAEAVVVLLVITLWLTEPGPVATFKRNWFPEGANVAYAVASVGINMLAFAVFQGPQTPGYVGLWAAILTGVGASAAVAGKTFEEGETSRPHAQQSLPSPSGPRTPKRGQADLHMALTKRGWIAGGLLLLALQASAFKAMDDKRTGDDLQKATSDAKQALGELQDASSAIQGALAESGAKAQRDLEDLRGSLRGDEGGPGVLELLAELKDGSAQIAGQVATRVGTKEDIAAAVAERLPDAGVIEGIVGRYSLDAGTIGMLVANNVPDAMAIAAAVSAHPPAPPPPPSIPSAAIATEVLRQLKDSPEMKSAMKEAVKEVLKERLASDAGSAAADAGADATVLSQGGGQ